MNSPEKVASTYLRLNGFLLLPNFTVFDGEHHTDIDLIGVRAPDAAERIGDIALPFDPLLTKALPLVGGRWIAMAAQVKAGRAEYPPDAHLQYVQHVVGGETRVVRAGFTGEAGGVSVQANGVLVSLEHALSWIWWRFDWMDENARSLTKDGSWAWSEPFLADLLLLRRLGLIDGGGPV